MRFLIDVQLPPALAGLISDHYHPGFGSVPVESVIRERPDEYNEVLGACDRAGNSTAFIEFGTAAVEVALRRFLETLQAEPTKQAHCLDIVAGHFGEKTFSRKD